MGKNDFKYLNQEFDNSISDPFKQKGFHAYRYMSDFEKFKEILPSKEKFYSPFTGEKIGDKEYGHVLKESDRFEMKAMKDYHDLYLKCDALLSAYVFEKFSNNSLKNYRLCTSRYLSAPALSWDAMPDMTKAEFELITDPDMVTFFEKRYERWSFLYF